MLDFLLVLILFFMACSGEPAWVPLPAVATLGEIALADTGSIWLPVTPAGVHGGDTAQTEILAWTGPTVPADRQTVDRPGDRPITVSENRS